MTKESDFKDIFGDPIEITNFSDLLYKTSKFTLSQVPALEIPAGEHPTISLLLDHYKLTFYACVDLGMSFGGGIGSAIGIPSGWMVAAGSGFVISMLAWPIPAAIGFIYGALNPSVGTARGMLDGMVQGLAIGSKFASSAVDDFKQCGFVIGINIGRAIGIAPGAIVSPLVATGTAAYSIFNDNSVELPGELPANALQEL